LRTQASCDEHTNQKYPTNPSSLLLSSPCDSSYPPSSTTCVLPNFSFVHNQIRRADQLLSVNGRSVEHLKPSDVIQLINSMISACCPVDIKTRSNTKLVSGTSGSLSPSTTHYSTGIDNDTMLDHSKSSTLSSVISVTFNLRLLVIFNPVLSVMGKASHVTLSLWPRAEPFAYGIFQVHPHPRLAVHNIKKLVTYAKNKSKTGSRLRTLNSFSELVHIPTILPATGYSKVTHAFHLRGLLSWIRSWLTQNPFSVENCIRNGRRLQWRLPHQVVLDNESGLNNTQQQPQNDIIKRQKIATNAHQVPRTGGHSG
ncbi:uncharacterized protein DC041_0004256, partial [Schistosoma bovis]